MVQTVIVGTQKLLCLQLSEYKFKTFYLLTLLYEMTEVTARSAQIRIITGLLHLLYVFR